jgi:hypothetical protein
LLARTSGLLITKKYMGSGKPKHSDRPIINTPRKVGNGGSGGAQSHEDINEICLQFFNVRLQRDSLLSIGQKLAINTKGDVLLNSRAVGKLTTTQIKRIENCSKLGYRYRGIVAQDKTKEFYGQFERYTA